VSAEGTDVHHRIRALDPAEDGMVVVDCACGWRSQPLVLTEDFIATWQRHQES